MSLDITCQWQQIAITGIHPSTSIIGLEELCPEIGVAVNVSGIDEAGNGVNLLFDFLAINRFNSCFGPLCLKFMEIGRVKFAMFVYGKRLAAVPNKL